MSNKMMTIKILRYRPEIDNEPFLQQYEVPYTDDTSILDALQYIKDHLDGTLSWRWSCRMAVCGSCGVMVQNEPVLACKTFLRDYFPEIRSIEIKALDNFPIERDLMVTVEKFVDKLESIKPYIIPAEQKATNETFLQTPAQLMQYKPYTLCINCMLCYAACPQYALNNDFMGPAVLTLLQRYNTDSRDCGKSERMDVAATEEGVWGCTLVGECSEVCPKGVDPAAALQQLKVDVAKDYFMPKTHSK